jgi:transposase InsO family protein
VACHGEEEPVAPAEPGTAALPPQHLKLVAQDYDLQVLGVLVAPREPSEDSPEDQAMSDRTIEVLPLPRCCPTLRGPLLGTPILNKCTLQELALLGYEVAELTVAKYMRRRTSPRPSPSWGAFLHAHLREMVAVDFFLVPTLTFRLLFVFVVLRHDRRELLHLNVTDHPTAVWTARQIIEAFPEDSAPRFLLRDRDAIYGEEFARRVQGMGIREVLIAPRAPWQNPFVERVIGSIRRECLDHFLILNEAHLRKLLPAYVAYYNVSRPHQALENNSPQPRDVQPPSRGRITAIPQVAGLHHRYQRAA